MAVATTPTYYIAVTNMIVKSFIVQAPAYYQNFVTINFSFKTFLGLVKHKLK